MRLKVLPSAKRDLRSGARFYERKEPGVGGHFIRSLSAEIDSLALNGGIHPRVYGYYHWMVSRRFPYAIFYKVENNPIIVYAVLDTRRDPARIMKRLQ